ncbi:hypothetical protein TraAM80_06711 [Trypanosoma rangeli]|uniref:Uncharacterized protein n=1 Tax=Trypanosoma rangeli TaxID=5698 RepID=A0A3R7K565_TRYRA|nr:uncharacterized protein TraAM80_06711 [Trypanosoma rangeli]RNF01870.1 hypothetical protein TraAM80_06711 [Trypanosoma rangeli]|eukprot:RNF01870.1 hypothetical protein TraAM80_06711 [Trypanosoma rangeli]
MWNDGECDGKEKMMQICFIYEVVLVAAASGYCVAARLQNRKLCRDVTHLSVPVYVAMMGTIPLCIPWGAPLSRFRTHLWSEKHDIRYFLKADRTRGITGLLLRPGCE